MNRLNPFDWNYYFGDFYSFPKTTITTKISFKATKTEYQLEVHLAGKKKEDVEMNNPMWEQLNKIKYNKN